MIQVAAVIVFRSYRHLTKESHFSNDEEGNKARVVWG